MTTDWEGRRGHCLGKSYLRPGLHNNKVSNILLQYTRGRKGAKEHPPTPTFRKPLWGRLLLRSSDIDLEGNYMQVSKAN